MLEVKKFEKTIADYFGSSYAVATDSCTHAIELCLRLTKPANVTCPKHTYVSVPMTFEKLNLSWSFSNESWRDFYCIGNTNIYDAAVYWKEDGYIRDTFMCLSFQFKKHLNIGRGGMILLNDKEHAATLKKMSYDGRLPDKPWAEQDIDIVGYHYYMTPENAIEGCSKFEIVKNIIPQSWSWENYPDISLMKVFQ